MESELSDGNDPDYQPLSGTGEIDCNDGLSNLGCLSTPKQNKSPKK